MSVLKIKDENGNWISILAIKGDKGDKGEIPYDYINTNFANTIKRTKSGNMISVNDVSPIEHNLDVKLSSEAITDFTGVEVARYGKNLFDWETEIPLLRSETFPDSRWELQADGSYRCQNVGMFNKVVIFENTNNYTGQFSVSVTAKSDRNTSEIGLCFAFRFTDGTSEFINTNATSDYAVYTSTTTAGKVLDRIELSYGSSVGAYIKDIMIAYGTDTEYEPYNCQTETADEYGVVIGLTSVSPNMTVLVKTDTSNMGGETNTGDEENLITDIEHKIQNIITPNSESGYTIKGEATTDSPIASFRLSKYTLEAGIYTLDLGNVTSDLYLQLSYGMNATPFTEKTDSTGKLPITVDTTAGIDVLTLWASKEGYIDTTVTPRLYKGIDKNVYIDLTYNADTKKYIDNELAKIKAELSAAILNS